jgi:hypothetical protein
MGMSVVAKGDDRLEKMAIRPFSMCPRSGESIFASAMIDWRRIRKNSSISEELIRAKFEAEKNSSEFPEPKAEQSKQFFQNRFSSLPFPP